MVTTPRTIETEEASKLLAELLGTKELTLATKKNLRNFFMALLMLEAGLRVGEVVQLKQSDLVLGGRPVTALRLRSAITKTHVERIVPLSELLQGCIATLRDKVWFDMADDNGFFAFYNDVPRAHITTRQVQRIIKAAAAKVIGRKVTPHALRHTFGTKMMRVTSLPVVQELLGHKSLSSTQIYMHPNETDKRKAIDSQGQNG